MMFLTLVVLAVAFNHVSAHTYHLGECPKVDPAPDFNMDKFLGKWYVLQKTSTGSSCLINNYTIDHEEPGKFKLEQISEHFILGLAGMDHRYRYTGSLSVPNRSSPATMRVKFPLNVVGGADYTVFMTDYDTYAGVFTCQKLAFAHRSSATILSRTPTLEKSYLDKIRNKLSGFGVDPFELSIIKRENCTTPTDGTKNINIDDETFTPQSFGSVVRKAGEKFGDGVEAIGEGAKKLYNKVRGDSKENLDEDRDLKNDAEWLP